MSNDYQQPMANGEPHPLKDVPSEVLACARESIRLVADCGDIHRDLIEPVADAVVMALHESGHINVK